MNESWKPVEESVNKKEITTRENLSGTKDLDIPDDLQEFLTETITNDVDFSTEENALIELRMRNVREAARAFHNFDKRIATLKDAKLKFEEHFPINSAHNRPPQVIEAMRKIDAEIEGIETSIAELTLSNPEAYIVRNALELREYRKELKSGDFVLTPYAEKKLNELQDNYYAIDKIPFLNGETGSGKSSVAKHFCGEVLGVEPERISGAKGIDETKIFGKVDLTSDERGPQANFVLGPLYRAMEQGVPLIIEEVNAIPPEILKSLNDIIINAKRGEEVPVIGDPKGSRMTAKPGFGVIMTGNLNRNPKAIDRYKGLFELSADFVNRVRPIDYDYLPQATEGTYHEAADRKSELYTLMVAMLMNDKGDVNAPEDAFDDLWRLAKFIRKVQEVYSGQRDGKLFSRQAGLNVPLTATSSVISMRDVKQVIESWKRDNFENEFDYYIYKELIAPLTNGMDVKFFVQQLQAEGFLSDDSWKATVAKAGTFDSAIHAPENKGKELQFTTVREVVENVYGKIPNRSEFPYDLDGLKRYESAPEEISEALGTIREYIRAESAPDLVTHLTKALEEGESISQKFNELISKLRDVLAKGDTKEIVQTCSELKTTEDTAVQSFFGKVLEVLSNEYPLEAVFLTALKNEYTDKFKVDQSFVLQQSRLLRESFEKLEPQEKLNIQKKYRDTSLRQIFGVSEGINKNWHYEALEAMRTKGLKSGNPEQVLFGRHMYPNLIPDDRIIDVGAENLRSNPELRHKEDLAKIKITFNGFEKDLFDDADTIFKDDTSVRLVRFYANNWQYDIDEKLNPFGIDLNTLKFRLSGFVYSEPWMIRAYIRGEEEWRTNDSVKESFSKLYKDPVFFCVKRKDGSDELIEVKRIGDFSWLISRVPSNGTNGPLKIHMHQFIAPSAIQKF